MKSLKLNHHILATIVGILFVLTSNFAHAQQKCADLFTELPYQNETTRFNAPKNFMDRILSVFERTSVENFQFEGPALSKAQLSALAKFSKQAGHPLEKGDKIKIASLLELKSEVHTSVGTQRLMKNGKYEERLLAESSIDEKPREVLSFRLIYRDGTVVETPILVKGDLNSVNFDKGENQLFDFINHNSSGIDVIEIAHTHPTYAVLITSPNGTSRYRANELSEGDLLATVEFARKWPAGKTIFIKAILPNGFHYIAGLNSGR